MKLGETGREILGVVKLTQDKIQRQALVKKMAGAYKEGNS